MDPRIARTRSRLQEALFALARERPVDEITVSDIAERAGVNRSTFYQHYSDRDTLFADALDGVAERAGASPGEIDPWSDQPTPVLVNFLTHVDAHAELYARAFVEPGSPAALARLRRHIHAAVHRIAEAPEADLPADVPVDIMAAGIAGSIIGVIGAWLEQEPRETPAVAARWAWLALGKPPPRSDPHAAV